MKLFLASASLLLLVGCSPVPIKPTFPDAIDYLMVSCPELKMVPQDTTKLSETLKIITSNYEQYHICRAKVDAWIKWYNDQKNVYNSVK